MNGLNTPATTEIFRGEVERGRGERLRRMEQLCPSRKTVVEPLLPLSFFQFLQF